MYRKKNFAILFILLIVCIFSLPSTVPAQEIICKVTSVLDGDTFKCVLPNKDKPVAVRMKGIDAPEKGQPYGKESKKMLAERIRGKMVKLSVSETDKYGRLVAYVWLDNQNVNLEQVRSGMAWAYKDFLDRPYASEFYSAEESARKNNVGLWRQKNPLPPWEYRKKKK